MGVSANFSKFLGEGEVELCQCALVRNNLSDFVSPQNAHQQVANWLPKSGGEISGYFSLLS